MSVETVDAPVLAKAMTAGASTAAAPSPAEASLEPSLPSPAQASPQQLHLQRRQRESANIATDILPLPSAPMKRRRPPSSSAKSTHAKLHKASSPYEQQQRPQQSKSICKSPSGYLPCPKPHYLAPTQAAAARSRRTTFFGATEAKATGIVPSNTREKTKDRSQSALQDKAVSSIGCDTADEKLLHAVATKATSIQGVTGVSERRSVLPKGATLPETSVVEEVLNKALRSSPLSLSTAAAAVVTASPNSFSPSAAFANENEHTSTPTQVEVEEMRLRRSRRSLSHASTPAQQQQQQIRPTKRSGRFSTLPATRKAEHTPMDADNEDGEGKLMPAAEVCNNDDDENAANAFQLSSLQFQPFPPRESVSAQVTAALGDVPLSSSTGTAGETTDILLGPTGRMKTFVQAALAAERANLLYESPDKGNADSSNTSKNNWNRYTDFETTAALKDAQKRARSPPAALTSSKLFCASSFQPSAAATATAVSATAVGAAFTPAVVEEFVKIEADAEAVEKAEAAVERAKETERDRTYCQTAVKPKAISATPGSPLPFTQKATSTVSDATSAAPPTSAQAESAAVLHELQAMQARLHERGYRHGTPHACVNVKQQRQQREGSQHKGYASSPCDISASCSSSSSSNASSSTADLDILKQRAKWGIVDWAAASVTEIVDAVDRGAVMYASRVRHSRSGRDSSRKLHRLRCRDGTRRGASKHFCPDVYVHALLEGQVKDSDDLDEYESTTASSFGELPTSVDDTKGQQKDKCSHENRSSDQQTPLLSQALRREALIRAGPSWAAAAAEAGVTPSEVRDLLRYSLNAPEAAVWLSDTTHHKNREKEIRKHNNYDLHAQHDEKRDGSDPPQQQGATTKSGSRNDNSKAEGKEKASPGPISYALDAATQTALVHRIVRALPTIPEELKIEMAHQRHLLEKVCQEVNAATAPVHRVLRERLAAPTASSTARQPPSWVEFNTSAPTTEFQTINQTDVDVCGIRVGEERLQQHSGTAAAGRAYEAQLFASLPPPARQALSAVAGLNKLAADPTRSLPPFHTVIAPPPPSQAPTRAQDSVYSISPPVQQRPQQHQQRQPYEAALLELSERERSHYVQQLDHLRSTYDRQLTEERRQRGQERRQYAALLESQQQKMLQHHRETIHLLQREVRLQQQQQDSLVQQLAATQAAASERQQRQHEQTTRKMLMGAVDVMKNQLVTAAQMDTYAGLQGDAKQQRLFGREGRASSSSSPARTAAAKLARVKRIHVRTEEAAVAAEAEGNAKQGASRSPFRVPAATTPPRNSSAAERATLSTKTVTEAPAEFQVELAFDTQGKQQRQRKVRNHVVQTRSPTEDNKEEDEHYVGAHALEASTQQQQQQQQRDLDADIPTSGHLTPLQRQESVRTSHSASALTTPDRHPQSASDESMITRSVDRVKPDIPILSSVEAPPQLANTEPTAALVVKSPREDVHARPAARIGSPPKEVKLRTTLRAQRQPPARSSPPSSPSAPPALPHVSALELKHNTTETLRAVYGAANRTNESKFLPGDLLKFDAHRSDGLPISALPTQHRRMTLPLRVNLPPEDELDAYLKRAEAAKAAVDARALEAARAAGLEGGTKLYTAQTRKRRQPQQLRKFKDNKEPNESNANGEMQTDRRTLSAPPVRGGPGFCASSPLSAPLGQHQLQRSRTTSSRVRSSRGRGSSRGGRGQQHRELSQPRKSVFDAAAVTGVNNFAGSDRHFDLEVVTVLSSELEAVHSAEYATQKQQQHWSVAERCVPVDFAYATFKQPTGSAALAQQNFQQQQHLPQQQSKREARSDAGIIAGKPCVGPLMLVLSDPVTTIGLENENGGGSGQRQQPLRSSVRLSPRTGRISPAAFTHFINAQLRNAHHTRRRAVAALRDAAERRDTQLRMSATTVGSVAEYGEDEAAQQVGGAVARNAAYKSSSPPVLPSSLATAAAGMLKSVGPLPPCDANFLGAPADVIITEDSRISSAALAPLGVSPVNWSIDNNSSPEAFDDLLLHVSAPSPADIITEGQSAVHAISTTAGMTDYARAWERYEAAERSVEQAAVALAVEDAGVLEAVARGQQQQQQALKLEAAVTLPPRQASISAAVRYREQLFSNQKNGNGGGGVYVSAKMADEARALRTARRRLAQIRACFVSPPAFDSNKASQVGAAFTGNEFVLPPPTLPTPAGTRDAELMQKLVDETVVSIFEAEGNAQRDPVRQVVTAMEHELLRLMLENELAGGIITSDDTTTANPASQAASRAGPSVKQEMKDVKGLPYHNIDPELLDALVEAVLEEVVQTALQKRTEGVERNKQDQQLQQSSSFPSKDHERDVLARALRRYAEGGADNSTPVEQLSASAKQEEQLQREYVGLPVTPSTAWLHDAVVSSNAHPTPPAGETKNTAMKTATEISTASPITTELTLQALPPSVENNSGNTPRDALVTTAAVVPLLVPTAASASHAGAVGTSSGTIPSQELRIVLHLSPVARQLLIPPDVNAVHTQSALDPVSARQRWNVLSNLPPMQHEQLPSRRMLSEDRRDVIVEAEVRPKKAPNDKESKAEGPSEEIAENISNNADQMLSLENPPEKPPEEPARINGIGVGKTHEPADTQTAVESSPSIPSTVLPPPLPPLPPPVLSSAGDVDEKVVLASVPAAATGSVAGSTSVFFRVLFSNLIDHEVMQRATFVDREEEQWQLLVRLSSLVRHDSDHGKPTDAAASLTPTLHRNRHEEQAAHVAAAVTVEDVSQALSKASSLLNSPARSLAPAALPQTVASQPTQRNTPAPTSLPPVRDPVMSAVLQWVYQFGSAQRRNRGTASSQECRNLCGAENVRRSSDMVRQLQFAAGTAGLQGGPLASPHDDDARRMGGDVINRLTQVGDEARHSYPDAYVPQCSSFKDNLQRCQESRAPPSLSQPSTRNLGSGGASNTSTLSFPASSSDYSPSPPSSLHTSSSSTLTDTNWANKVERTEHQKGAAAAATTKKRNPSVSTRVRPVLDAQHFQFRRSDAVGKGDNSNKAIAAAVDYGSSDTATTRYTTTSTSSSSTNHRSSDSNRNDQQYEKKRTRPAGRAEPTSTTLQTSNTGEKKDDAVDSVSFSCEGATLMTSEILPQRVSAEVQSALAAALRVYQRSQNSSIGATNENDGGLQQVNPTPSIQGVADTSAGVLPDFSSQSAVTLPTNSPEATLRLESPRYFDKAPGPPQQQSRHNHGGHQQKHRMRPPQRALLNAHEPHASPHQQHKRAVPLTSPSAQWEQYSLTSTSTSTHVTNNAEQKDRERKELRSEVAAHAPVASVARNGAGGVRASPALPFLYENGVTDVPQATSASTTPTAVASNQLNAPFSSVLSLPQHRGPLMSPDVPFSAAALREEVLRVQQEQRGGSA